MPKIEQMTMFYDRGLSQDFVREELEDEPL